MFQLAGLEHGKHSAAKVQRPFPVGRDQTRAKREWILHSSCGQKQDLCCFLLTLNRWYHFCVHDLFTLPPSGKSSSLIVFFNCNSRNLNWISGNPFNLQQVSSPVSLHDTVVKASQSWTAWINACLGPHFRQLSGASVPNKSTYCSTTTCDAADLICFDHPRPWSCKQKYLCKAWSDEESLVGSRFIMHGESVGLRSDYTHDG